ncbi:M20 family metallopeptidase [Paralimibaculum aggregatum]|uniref:M20 family metallopeptidase n=1 Tax=Paralimibaculum aggregatum TaxID=3036245 RepID=A0ABQ6LPL2_9RHOB|nr:M20 family metallopeptidase [Limibaculum sp. NKW23]GMG83722.1 M20 family metallopeptidase [Limibaculum sp. NKW23]
MSARSDALARATAYVDNGEFEAELARLVAIPSESQVPEGLPHCRRYLCQEIVPMLADLGFACDMLENPFEGCGPVLLATRHEGAELPTVLGYGHGDVIRGLDDKWTKGAGPWQLARDGDRLYGRGTADNKGQHLIDIRAMATVLEVRGHLGFNAKMLIEMGEENGSRGLREVIAAHKADFAADVFIGSDGPRVRPDRPTISLGNRGAVNFDLVCDLREGGHHSGNWGGALADPATILAHAIATIVSPRGEIRVPEWRPEPIRPLVRELLDGVELDGGAGGPEVEPDWGEPDLTPAERVYAWNSFAVLAMLSGIPESPVNAIAPWARAHCQLRFIKGTDAGDVLPALRRHLEREGFHGAVRVSEPPAGNAAGFAASRTEPDAPWAAWVREAIQRQSGQAPAVLPQMGGSICNDLFTDLLGQPAIWVPHSYAGCSQHAPDEHVLLPVCREAMELMTALYWDLGESGGPA